ncbi:MAG TPA: hypothetical protein PLJ98_06875, partial [Acholeplasmataceae bacterium]|nr:hypothetical protein [Acholeplasmataceae bacterium]
MLRLMKNFRWFHWVFVVIIIGLIYGQVQMDLALPEYMGNIIVLIAQGAQTGIAPTSDILKEGGMMLLVTFGSITATIFA